jgi:hypothetical protein
VSTLLIASEDLPARADLRSDVARWEEDERALREGRADVEEPQSHAGPSGISLAHVANLRRAEGLALAVWWRAAR